MWTHIMLGVLHLVHDPPGHAVSWLLLPSHTMSFPPCPQPRVLWLVTQALWCPACPLPTLPGKGQATRPCAGITAGLLRAAFLWDLRRRAGGSRSWFLEASGRSSVLRAVTSCSVLCLCPQGRGSDVHPQPNERAMKLLAAEASVRPAHSVKVG